MSAGISGVGTPMAELMQTLLQAVNQQIDLSTRAIAVNVENKAAVDKMAIAQSIIDAYA